MPLPSLDEFLNSSLADVATIAPETMVFLVAGTRRAAALAGVNSNNDEYVSWNYQQMMNSFGLIFDHGVRHLIVLALFSSQLAEETPGYRENLLRWTEWGLAGPEALADYQKRGWRVRMVGMEHIPELKPTAERLHEHTAATSEQTLWWFNAPTPESFWESLFTAVRQQQVTTRAEAMDALYGEQIPLATLCLSFGKPMYATSLISPLLVGEFLHSYWRQRPGYQLNQEELRRILYDYAYLRPTGRKDKTGRAEEAIDHRYAWENGPILGLGMRLGPFWYPESDDPQILALARAAEEDEMDSTP